MTNIIVIPLQYCLSFSFNIPFAIGAITLKRVGVKINYHLLTSIYVTSILSYTVLEDDANDEK
ncbi:SX2_G0035080.mRNA.1.CDS.1 [Saccharomyces cerevisiae]|nr:SX2_G0035080.mRNA.1.CDS.1 [Saccharomyces cerevisiae]